MAKRYGINPKTAAKWRKRGTSKISELSPHSTRLSLEEEAAFRRPTLPL
jgi:predicted site-specific integrase-resolvase